MVERETLTSVWGPLRLRHLENEIVKGTVRHPLQKLIEHIVTNGVGVNRIVRLESEDTEDLVQLYLRFSLRAKATQLDPLFFSPGFFDIDLAPSYFLPRPNR